MQPAVSAESVIASSTYRAMRKPAYPGQLRAKSWGAVLDPREMQNVWDKRAKDYWDLQARTYGLRFNGYTLTFHVNEEGQQYVVTTVAQVESILPGERTR